MTIPPPPSASRRTTAAILNCFFPGLGQWYMGRVRSAIVYVVLSVGLMLAMIPDMKVMLTIQIPTMDQAMEGAQMPPIPGRLEFLFFALMAVFAVSIWDVVRPVKASPETK